MYELLGHRFLTTHNIVRLNHLYMTSVRKLPRKCLAPARFLPLNVPENVVVVVELPQAPEDDPQKRESCAWKSVGLVTVGVCVW